MEKIIIVLIILISVFSFSSCSNNNNIDSIVSTTQPSIETSETIPLLTESSATSDLHLDEDIYTTLDNLIESSFDIRCLYFVSAEELYDWNDEKNIKEINNWKYHLVTHRFLDYKAFSNYISNVFTSELAEISFNKDQFLDIDGKLYARDGAAGTLYNYKEYTYEIIALTQTDIEIKLSIPADELTDMDISTMKFVNQDGIWKICYEQYGITPPI